MSYPQELFSIGGNLTEQMAYMVKNPGLLPEFDTIHQGELHRSRRAIRDTMRACWRSCFEPVPQPDSEGEVFDTKAQHYVKAFVADAIIVNPPSFAHIHCAERLGVPLHLVFIMPWSPTQEFPHPLANVRSTEPEAKMANVLSYFLIDTMVWQGLGDIVNRFRYKILGLEPIDPTQAPSLLQRFHVPYLLLHPPESLMKYLEAGPLPVYIGFGSIVAEDPVAMTNLVHRAIRLAGVHAIVSQG
ncbi:hypothetical protein LTR70_005020 [Exophiala xenobiotica]|uniref:UDP-glucuronosyltransferase n=1 Tax=Lithohypha guttulata TaxID=1690604 RepID=A0ABR0KCI3_9EURO|nr:hypothetical protein LTR24_004424 [Lithohypha guttulata]KAK5319401.1 hypothetical protein LTR70_005020 [Exophiala xenobiotica]